MLPDWLEDDEQKIAWISNKKNLLMKMTKKRFEEAVYEKLNKSGSGTMEDLDEWLDENMDAFQRQRMQIEAYYDGILNKYSSS